GRGEPRRSRSRAESAHLADLRTVGLMSPKLRRLSSRELVASLRALGFEVVATRGSHAKLRRLGPGGERQTLTVPLHDDLAAGTLSAIYRQVCRYVPAEAARPLFFR